MSENHPAVNYVNSVNKRINNYAVEVAENTIFLIVEHEDGDLGFLASTCDISDIREWNPTKKFYTRTEISAERIHSAISHMAKVGVNGLENAEQKRREDSTVNLRLKESREIVLSACVMHFLGFDDVSTSILKAAFFNEEMKFGQLKFVYYGNSVITNYKQSKISSKPRNPHYAEALRIATLTWKKYPGASKKAMCENLKKHFDGEVSIDSLNSWIKKQKIQPPKPERHTSFCLVLS